VGEQKLKAEMSSHETGWRTRIEDEKRSVAFSSDNIGPRARIQLYKHSLNNTTLNPELQRLQLRNAANITQDSDAGHDS
jgi:hypothetical protein